MGWNELWRQCPYLYSWGILCSKVCLCEWCGTTGSPPWGRWSLSWYRHSNQERSSSWMVWARRLRRFEHDEYVGTGIIACTPKHPIIRHFLDIYNHIHYYEGLKFSLTTNVRRFTDIMKAQGFIMNNQRQELNGFLLFHKSYFVEKTGKRVAMILTKPLCSMISKAHGGRKDGIIFGDIDSIALKQLSLGR